MMSWYCDFNLHHNIYFCILVYMVANDFSFEVPLMHWTGIDPHHALDGLGSPHLWSVGMRSLCLKGTCFEYVSTDILLGITGNCKEVEGRAFMTCTLHSCIKDGFVVQCSCAQWELSILIGWLWCYVIYCYCTLLSRGLTLAVLCFLGTSRCSDMHGKG